MSQNFTAHIANESFEFGDFHFDDQKVTGAQIAEAMNAHPLTDFVVLVQLKSLELESLRPTELADLSKSLRFFVIKGDATYNFVVDGLSMAWPQKRMSGLTIKRLMGKDDEDIELLLEREDQADKVINDDDEVRLDRDGVEKFKTCPAKILITIIVEAEPHQWPKGEKITYAQVVTLAFPDFPQHPERTYSVTYRKGEGHHHEGVLAPGDSVKVKDGMEFNVTDTGQS